MDTDGILSLMQATAEEVVRPRFRKLAEVDIAEKGPGDYVTVADRESETMLAGLLREAYPHAAIVGEEAVFDDPGILRGLANFEHAFVIDPIDGTGNFVRGKGEYGMILAELRAGLTTRGWIWQPETGRAYVAERGAGATANGELIERKTPNRLPLGASSKRSMLGYDAGGRLNPTVASHFCCAFDYPAVLAGDIDFMSYTSMHPWDHLAGSLMLTESGGVSRTFDGLAYSALSRGRGLLIAGDTLSWMTAQQCWPI